MKGGRLRKIEARPTSFRRSQREIHLLEVDEVTLVESAKRFKYATANQEEGTNDLIHDPGV